MEQAFFVLTACIVFTGLFKFFGLVLGNGMTLPMFIPLFGGYGPTHFALWYPSTMFQIWYWTQPLFA
jgi:hypothetical protein